jgi:hypothetical protein
MDPELLALDKIRLLVAGLDGHAQLRVLRYSLERAYLEVVGRPAPAVTPMIPLVDPPPAAQGALPLQS